MLSVVLSLDSGVENNDICSASLTSISVGGKNVKCCPVTC